MCEEDPWFVRGEEFFRGKEVEEFAFASTSVLLWCPEKQQVQRDTAVTSRGERDLPVMCEEDPRFVRGEEFFRGKEVEEFAFALTPVVLWCPEKQHVDYFTVPVSPCN